MGEIDCRNDEGIFKHCLKKGQGFHNIIEKMVNDHIALLLDLTQTKNIELIIYGVPAPHPTKVFELEPSQQKLFKELIAYFNSYLGMCCQWNDILFLDVYKMTNRNGVSNLAYHVDLFHLKPETIGEIFNDISL